MLTIRVCLMSILPKVTLYAYLCLFVLIHLIGVFRAFWHFCSVLRLPPNTRNFLGDFYKRTQEDERKWMDCIWTEQTFSLQSIGWAGWFVSFSSASLPSTNILPQSIFFAADLWPFFFVAIFFPALTSILPTHLATLLT